jgi:hypothetical protein
LQVGEIDRQRGIGAGIAARRARAEHDHGRRQRECHDVSQENGWGLHARGTDIPDLPRPLRVCTSGRRLLIQKNRPAKKIFPCLFDRFDKISLRERALTNV